MVLPRQKVQRARRTNRRFVILVVVVARRRRVPLTSSLLKDVAHGTLRRLGYEDASYKKLDVGV